MHGVYRCLQALSRLCPRLALTRRSLTRCNSVTSNVILDVSLHSRLSNRGLNKKSPGFLCLFPWASLCVCVWCVCVCVCVCVVYCIGPLVLVHWPYALPLQERLTEHPRRRSNSLTRNGSVSADALHSLREKQETDDSQALEDFLQKKKSSFKQRNRAMSVMKLQVSRGRRRSSATLYVTLPR